MRTTLFKILVLIAALVLLTGCVRESTSGQRHEFGYQWWVSGSLFLAGVALTLGAAFNVFIGWKRHSSKTRGGWIVMLLIGPIVAFGAAPTAFLYRLTVDNSGFSVRSGVWGVNVYDKKFANLTRIRLFSKIRHGGRGRSETNYFLECHSKNGSVETVPLDDGVWSTVGKAALPLIRRNAGEHRIVFVNETLLHFPQR